MSYPHRGSFIGRERELAELRAGLEDASAGRGGFFLLTGDPGIGKSRLANEIAAGAAKSGWSVCRGSCWEGGGAPAYWPFVQIIRSALDNSGHSMPTRRAKGVNAFELPEELAQLVPDLLPPAAHSESSTQAAVNPDAARFKLFDAAARSLRSLSELKPLVLIIEDLHDADQPSLFMLRLVVRQLKDARVLIIGTYRDAEVRRSPVLSQLIGELTREGIQIPLVVLSRDEAARMIEARNGAPAAPRLVSEIYQATAGNPLFIDGLVRVLIGEDRLSGPARLDLSAFRVPDGVREAIRQWLALLSDRSALIVAATIGQEFDLTCLQRVTQLSNDQIIDLLREASRAGILVQVSRDTYRFSHALVRNALCDELSAADSSGLHLKIACVLEDLYRADLGSHAAQLAHHFREGGDLDKAIGNFIEAGEAARAVFAYEETAVNWRTALELMPDTDENRVQRADLLDRLGHVLTLNAAEFSPQIQLFEQALELYQRLGRTQATAVMHLRLFFLKALKPVISMSEVDQHSNKALELLRQDPAPLSSILCYVHLGLHSARLMKFDEALTAIHQAINLSEQAIDKQDGAQVEGTISTGITYFKGRARGMQAAILGYLGGLRTSFDLADEIWLKTDHHDTIGAWMAAGTACQHLLMLLDPTRAAAWVNRELGRPRISQASFVETSLQELVGLALVLMGDLAGARVLVAGSPVRPFFGGYSLKEHLALYTGDWPAPQRLLAQSMDEQIRADGPLLVCVRSPVAARMLRLQGFPLEAESRLEKILTMLPEGPGALIEMVARQEMALDCVDSGRSAQAQVHLQRCLKILAGGEDWRGLTGCLARAEGAIAAAQGRFDEAYSRFAQSVEICRRYQVPFEEGETLHYWGRALIAAGDHRGALEKLDAAADLFRRHGAGQCWLDRIQADHLRAEAADASSAQTIREMSPATAEKAPLDSELTGIFRKDGEYWTVAWAGVEARLKERKGFYYIAWLLRYPGREFAALDLAPQVESADVANPRAASSQSYGELTITAGLGDAGVALDSKARAQYQQRLQELREELDRAEQLNDNGATQKMRGEIEFIEDEIAAAVGLGGRTRKAGSPAERARLAVTKAIKAALVQIRRANPELGRHLASSIRTGNFCVYLPQQPIEWLL